MLSWSRRTPGSIVGGQRRKRNENALDHCGPGNNVRASAISYYQIAKGHCGPHPLRPKLEGRVPSAHLQVDMSNQDEAMQEAAIKSLGVEVAAS